MKFRAWETTYSTPDRVDRQAGILYGCKLLGKTSKNGRVYSDKALNQAAKLYETLGIDLDHHKDKKTDRSIRDLIALRPKNVKVTKDGVFGDVHLLLNDPMTPKLLEAAERDPMVFGFSHEADLGGSKDRRTGKVTVESVNRVHSLDMVRHPATTLGAFESMDESHITEAEEPTAEPESCKELLARAMVLAEKEGDVELAQKIHRLIKPDKGEEGAEEEAEAEVEGEEAEEEARESVQRKVDVESLGILANRYGVPKEVYELIDPQASMKQILTAFESYKPARKKVGNVEQGTPLPEEKTPKTHKNGVVPFKIS